MSHCCSFPGGFALVAGLVFTSVASAQTSQTWVKDLNTTPVTRSDSFPNPVRGGTGRNAQQWLKMGRYFYFWAENATSGFELFRSDGTTTTLVKDINPGKGSSYPSMFTLVGSKIYFAADDGSKGFELWVTDGTASGTVLVKDILPGSLGSAPVQLTRLGNKVLFSAGSKGTGKELWVTDGTSTVLLKDIRVGSLSSNPSGLTSNQAGGKVFFAANDGIKGTELWVTDGTPAGTVLVKDIYTGTNSASSNPMDFRPLGAKQVVFTALTATQGKELWISDGTAANTRLVKDVSPGTNSGTNTNAAISMGGKVLFAGYTPSQGWEPWITDGTAANTVILKDLIQGPSSGYYTGSYGDTDGAKAWFGCKPRLSTRGYEIWVTDGTSLNTRRFSSGLLQPPEYIAATAGKVFFRGSDVTGRTGYELCMTDGTTTTTVKDIRFGSGSSYPTFIGKIGKGTVALRANDGAGDELWISQGTAATTRMIDINRPVGPQPTADDKVQNIETLFGKVIFSATDGIEKAKGQHGQELWISDGSGANTRLLKDIHVGTSTTTASHSNPGSLCRLGNYVYFAAKDGILGNELWRTDGTAAGTKLFVDIRLGSLGSSPSGMTRIGDKIYFTANDGSKGYELWVTDGKVSGTRLVKDIYVGSMSSSPKSFARLGRTNKVLFSAWSPGKGAELWVSDGTSINTTLVKDIASAAWSSNPAFLTSYKGKVYFQAYAVGKGAELWTSDGTAQGTTMVKDGILGIASGMASYITVQNGKLYYYGYTVAAGAEMHRSDGTTANTGLYWDMSPGRSSTYPSYITSVGSRRVYFQGSSIWGVEPMLIDVTNKVRIAWNLNGAGDSSPSNYSNGRDGFAVDSGHVYATATGSTNYADRQLLRLQNGATAQPIGRVQNSSSLAATDPRLGRSMAVSGSTAVANALSVLFLGLPDNAPGSLGTFVPDSYAYFKLTSYFFVAGGYVGAKYSLSIPLPNQASLMGQTLVLQSLTLNTVVFPAKNEMSNGVHITFGK